MLDTPEVYNTAWADLNTQLKSIEIDDGLPAAFAKLEEHQLESGFIKDHLFGVERHIFHHPHDPSLFFRVQFNAKRRERFNGAGVTSPPDGIVVANAGCFLCRDNVRWQQQGTEFGFDLTVGGNAYTAWMNPFPLLPNHAVIAAADHVGQDWSYGQDKGLPPSRLVADLVELAMRLPGHIGFYNGVDAGASIAGHLHFQFARRPEDLPAFPLEARLQSLRGIGEAPAIIHDYPLPVVKWLGEGPHVSDAAIRWLDDWAAGNVERLYRLTGNLIATADTDGTVALYFIPRDRAKTRGEGMSGLVGGLEVLGEVVFSSADERRLIDSGAVDYNTLQNLLCSVRTPLFTET